MDELQVKADSATIKRVARSYEHFGYGEYAQSLLEKYPTFEAQYRYVEGKKVKIRHQDEDASAGQQRNATSVVSFAEQSLGTDDSARAVMASVESSKASLAERTLEKNGSLDGKVDLRAKLGSKVGVDGVEELRLGVQEEPEET